MKNSKRKNQFKMPILFGIVFLFTFIFSSCNKEENIQPVQDSPDLIESLKSFNESFDYVDENASDDARFGFKKYIRKPTFFTLASALQYTGLFPTIVKNKLTLFAPDDQAFAEIGLNFWNIRKLDKQTLTNILLYHAAKGFIFSNQLPDCSLEMANGSSVGFKYSNNNVYIKDASDQFAKVIFTDRRAFNTVFHGIDKVLTPPQNTIAEIAVNNGNFTILVSLLQATGLDKVVADPNQNLTVFAPSDAAFQKLISDLAPFDIVGYLGAHPEELTKILLHHATEGTIFSFCLSDGMSVPTLNGDNLTVDLNNLSLISSSNNSVKLVPSLLDILATNGAIHVIDYVLIPSNLDLSKSM